MNPATETPFSKSVWSRKRELLLPLLAPTETSLPVGTRQSKLRPQHVTADRLEDEIDTRLPVASATTGTKSCSR